MPKKPYVQFKYGGLFKTYNRALSSQLLIDKSQLSGLYRLETKYASQCSNQRLIGYYRDQWAREERGSNQVTYLDSW